MPWGGNRRMSTKFLLYYGKITHLRIVLDADLVVLPRVFVFGAAVLGERLNAHVLEGDPGGAGRGLRRLLRRHRLPVPAHPERGVVVILGRGVEGAGEVGVLL